MSGDLIETDCRCCHAITFIEESGYCAACGAGPAVPSVERVDRVNGLRVTVPSDAVGRAAVWPGTRPRHQTVPVGARSKQLAWDDPKRIDRELDARHHGLTMREIGAAFVGLKAQHDRRPSREEVAGALNTSESTIKRAQVDAGWTGWPPKRPERPT
jgi:hypothetical protein